MKTKLLFIYLILILIATASCKKGGEPQPDKSVLVGTIPNGTNYDTVSFVLNSPTYDMVFIIDDTLTFGQPDYIGGPPHADTTYMLSKVNSPSFTYKVPLKNTEILTVYNDQHQVVDCEVYWNKTFITNFVDSGNGNFVFAISRWLH